jgi:hypothetical protein
MNEFVNDRVVLRSVSETEPLPFSFNGEVHGLISCLNGVTALVHADELILERREVRRFGLCGLEVFSRSIECPAWHFEQKTSTFFGRFMARSPSRNGQSFVASGGAVGDPFRYRPMFSITNRLSDVDKSPVTEPVGGPRRIQSFVSVKDFGLVFFADGAWFPGIEMLFRHRFFLRVVIFPCPRLPYDIVNPRPRSDKNRSRSKCMRPYTLIAFMSVFQKRIFQACRTEWSYPPPAYR